VDVFTLSGEGSRLASKRKGGGSRKTLASIKSPSSGGERGTESLPPRFALEFLSVQVWGES